MPFAGYENFDACVADQVSRGKSQEAAAKICGKLQAEHKQKDAISESTLPNSVANREQGVAAGGKKKKKRPKQTVSGVKQGDSNNTEATKGFNIILDHISRSLK